MLSKKERGAIRRKARDRGHKTYFTGEPCWQGHVSPRRVDSGLCVQCIKDASAARRGSAILRRAAHG